MALGSSAALDQLWARYQLPCLRLAGHVLGSRTHAEDVVQLVFLDVWRHAGRYDPARASAGAWILSMTHHKSVDRVRYEQRRRTFALDQQPTELAAVDDVATAVLRHESLRLALATLSAQQRQVLLLAYFGGLTYPEIATRLRVPLGTVKGRGRLGLRNAHAQLTDLEEAG